MVRFELSQNEIDALLAGVDTGSLNNLSNNLDDLIDNGEPEIDKIFLSFGKHKSVADTELQVFFGSVESILQNIIDAKRNSKLFLKMLQKANLHNSISAIAAFKNELSKITEETDKLISSGYEILLLDKRKKEEK
jgi:hypothetical protein